MFQRPRNFCVRSSAACGPLWVLFWAPGLGAAASAVHDPVIVPYESIPHFPKSTVEGHSGRLVAGRLGGAPVVVLQGRVHFYEGYSRPRRHLSHARLGASGRACGHPDQCRGWHRRGLPNRASSCLIADHINMMGWNPLVGLNEPRFAFDAPAAGCVSST